MEYKDLKFQIKGLTDQGSFSGYAAYKNNVDSYNDVILDGAFKRTILNKKNFPILFMHDPSKPIGLSTVMKEDANGLYTEGKLDIEGNETARMVYSGLRNGYIDAMSIGYKVVQDDMDKRGRRQLKEIKLLEYSLITKGFQANELATVSGFKASQDYESLFTRIKHLEEQHYKANEGEEDPLVDMELLERIADLEEEIKSIKEQLADSPEGTRPFLMPQDPDCSTLEMKGVSGASDLPIEEGEWDGPGAKKRIFEWAGGNDFDPKKAKMAFFYVDGDPKNRGSYKLPFADVRQGKLVAIKKGISSAQGALDGARGGIQGVSDSDKASIMSKINAYKKRMGDDKPKLDEDVFSAINDFKKYLRGDK